MNRALIGTLDRRLSQDTLAIDVPAGTAALDILVENLGRVNFNKPIREERKGITTSVTLDDRELTAWEVFPLPMSTMPMPKRADDRRGDRAGVLPRQLHPLDHRRHVPRHPRLGQRHGRRQRPPSRTLLVHRPAADALHSRPLAPQRRQRHRRLHPRHAREDDDDGARVAGAERAGEVTAKLPRMKMRLCLPLLAAIVASLPLAAQRATLTAQDYARGERFLAANLQGLVVGGAVDATWLPDDRFWYRNQTLNGTEIVVVDPVKKTRTAFADCAAAVVDCDAAPPAGGGRGGRGRGGRGGGPLSSDSKPLSVSPDGTRAVFARNWNLWVRDMKSGEEKALTTDGVKYFGYATDNAGWSSSDRAMVLWSPDSKKIATQQQDERNVGEMYLVNTTVGHPTLRVSKFPLPGDRWWRCSTASSSTSETGHASRACRWRPTSTAPRSATTSA